MNNLETSLDSKNVIHFRCPSCSKLYAAETTSIYTDEPEFNCNKCSTQFSISLLEALESSQVIGRPIVKTEEPPPQSIELPEASESVDYAKVEQSFADKRVEEVKDFEQLSFEDLAVKEAELDRSDLWLNVLSDYYSDQTHKDFIRICKERGDLDFAIQSYASVLDGDLQDEMASKNLDFIRLDLSNKIESKSVKLKPRFSAVNWLIGFILLFAIGLIVFGYFSPAYKNLTGLGMGILFFIFAIRAFFQPKS